MIFAVFDPSPLTLCINCSFFTFILIGTTLTTVLNYRADCDNLVTYFHLPAVKRDCTLNVHLTELCTYALYTSMALTGIQTEMIITANVFSVTEMEM